VSDSAPTPERHRTFSLRLDRLSGVYLWALIILTFSLWKPSLFLSMATVHQIASQQAVIGIMAIGLLVPLTAGTFDLSIGAVANLSTVVVVVLQTNQHFSIPLSIVVAVAVAVAIGLVNGFVVVKLGVSSFIVTLGMATIATAIQTIVAGGNQPYPPTNPAWSNITNTQVFGFNIIIVYLIVLALLFWWILDHTPAGRYWYAIGGNPEATRLSGGRVGLWTWLSLIISATLAGVAGVLYASNFGPSLTYGSALLLPAFAAAFLGSTQFRPGVLNLWGTLLAIFVLATGVQGFEYVTGAQWLSDMFNGVALICAVSFAVWRQRRAGELRRRRRSRSQAALPLDSAPPDAQANSPDVVPTEATIRSDIQ